MSVPAGAATDAAGNASLASTSTDNTVTYNAVAPAPIAFVQVKEATPPTNQSAVTVAYANPQLAGDATALWSYGYFAPGNPSLVDWHTWTPWWVADFLPNIESEIGMVLVCAGMVPIYWPPRR